MVQLTVDLSALDRKQSEVIAAFIMTYPATLAEPSPEEAFKAQPEMFTPPAPAATLILVPQPTAPGVDKAGLPWDERIHASSKTFTADGMWRKRRGVEDSLIVSVETELRSLMALPAPPTPAPAAVTPAVPPAPVAAVAPPAPAVDRKVFVDLIHIASEAMQAGKISQAEVNEALASVGVTSLPLLGNRLDLVPAVTTYIKELLASR